MKGFAFILSLLVLSIVTIPIVNTSGENNEKEHACCVLDHESENPSEDDCCENGCNPFINCCGMMGFIPGNPMQFTVSKTTFFQLISDTYRDPISDCIIDIWQPPRV
jgi:hypothetical protein